MGSGGAYFRKFTVLQIHLQNIVTHCIVEVRHARRGILWISSDGDDQMDAKIKIQKHPKKIPGPKINDMNLQKKILCCYHAMQLKSLSSFINSQ